jgi:hypothetical protein
MCDRQVVRIRWHYALPLHVARFSCRNLEHGHEPRFAVGPVVGEGLAGPLARHEHAPARVAEVFGTVGPAASSNSTKPSKTAFAARSAKKRASTSNLSNSLASTRT